MQLDMELGDEGESWQMFAVKCQPRVLCGAALRVGHTGVIVASVHTTSHKWCGW